MGDLLLLAAAFLLIFALLMPIYLKMSFGNKPTGKRLAAALTVKALATAAALCVALAACLRRADTFSLLMTVGLAVCTAADVIIGLDFMAGTAAFFLGHLLYITALILGYGFVWQQSLIAFAVGTAALLAYLSRYFKNAGKMLPPLLCYGAVLLAMFSAAAPLAFRAGTEGAALAFGGLFFMISDLLLAKNIFVKPTRVRDTLSLSCYYLGQYLLALGVFVPVICL